MNPKLMFVFVNNRNACYHVGGEQVSQASAEVACGKLGGRLESFVESTSIDKLQLALKPWIPSADMWLGKLSCFIVKFKKRICS